MSDLADILGVSKGTKSVKRVFEQDNNNSVDKLPKYLNKVVDNKTPPSAVPSFTENGVKVNKKVANKWKYAPFKSSARNDEATFYHWVKDGVEYPDYPFARFNIKNNILTYTEEEYQRIAQEDSWPKEETDMLFRLCRKYDLRWPVIYDRWKSLYGENQDALQIQYYSICRAIYRIRKEMGQQLTEEEEAILKYEYNTEYIIKRRQQLNHLFYISVSEEQKELKIREQIKKIDQQISLLGDDPMKDKDFAEIEDIPSALTNLPSISAFVPKGVSLRSQMMLAQPCINVVPESISKKIDLILTELGFPGALPMSTQHTTEAMNKLRQDILKILMIKKYIKQELERTTASLTSRQNPMAQNDYNLANKKRRKTPPQVTSFTRSTGGPK